MKNFNFNLFFVLIALLGFAMFSSACSRFSAREMVTADGGNFGSGGSDDEGSSKMPGRDCATVTVKWDKAVLENDLAGFRVFYGFDSKTIQGVVEIAAPKATSVSVKKLTENLTYYFAVTAYDFSGNESAKSETKKLTIPLCSKAPLVDVSVEQFVRN